MAGNITHVVTPEEFDKEVKQAKGLVIVDFWAPWCGPCKMLAPAYEALSEDENYSDVKFVKIDVDEAEDVAAECGIQAMPTLHIYRDGSKVTDKMGAMSKTELKEFIDSNK